MEVALFTRAWIEITKKYSITLPDNKSPSSRGRGLKCINTAVHRFPFRRPLHEGVD